MNSSSAAISRPKIILSSELPGSELWREIRQQPGGVSPERFLCQRDKGMSIFLSRPHNETYVTALSLQGIGRRSISGQRGEEEKWFWKPARFFPLPHAAQRREVIELWV